MDIETTEAPAPKKPQNNSALRHMVYCEDGGVPTIAHAEWGTAEHEAKRLSKLHPDSRFHLLQTRAVFVSGKRTKQEPSS